MGQKEIKAAGGELSANAATSTTQHSSSPLSSSALAQLYRDEEARMLHVKPLQDENSAEVAELPMYMKQSNGLRGTIGVLSVVPPLLVTSVGITPGNPVPAAHRAFSLAQEQFVERERLQEEQARKREAEALASPPATEKNGSENGNEARTDNNREEPPRTSNPLPAASEPQSSSAAAQSRPVEPSVPFRTALPPVLSRLLVNPELGKVAQLSEEALFTSPVLAPVARLPSTGIKAIVAEQEIAAAETRQALRGNGKVIMRQLQALEYLVNELERQSTKQKQLYEVLASLLVPDMAQWGSTAADVDDDGAFMSTSLVAQTQLNASAPGQPQLINTLRSAPLIMEEVEFALTNQLRPLIEDEIVPAFEEIMSALSVEEQQEIHMAVGQAKALKQRNTRK